VRCTTRTNSRNGPHSGPKRPVVFFSYVRHLLAFLAASIAGAINSVAGGGTLVSFPTLVWLGIPSINANATNTLALWPGSLGSMWGYRRELQGTDRRVWWLAVPSLAGGLFGAVLLYRTPTDVFDRLIPWLILFATVLFMVQEPLQRRFNPARLRHVEPQPRPDQAALASGSPEANRRGGQASHPSTAHWLTWTMVFQFLVGVYGGYFGAGIGILMLAALSIMGHTDIHQMNGVKNVLAVCINGIAAVYFAVSGLVLWQDSVIMAVGAIAGGIGGAGLARRLGRKTVRHLVVAIGFAMAVSMMLRL
jgi:uncharacterized protein